MVSIRTPSCSSPRPATSKAPSPVSCTLMATLPSAFAQQAVADDAGLHLVAFAAGQRRIVDRDRHRQGRRIDRLRLDRFFDDVAERVGDGGVLQAGDGDDVAGFGALDRHARQAAERQQLGDAGALDDLAVAVQRLDLAVDGDGAGFDAAGEDAAEIIVGFQRRHQHLERDVVARQRDRLGLGARRRRCKLEQRIEILVLVLQFLHRPAVAARGIEIVKVELVVIGFQRQEQIEDRFQRFLGLRVVAVDLVDDDDGLEAELQRLGEHEFGLRHDGFRRIDQQHDAVDHGQDALDLAAEIGMARRVDDIDVRAVPFDARCIWPEW